MNSHYAEYLQRKQMQYGAKFDPSDLDSRFAPYYHTGQRVKVRTCEEVLTGLIGATTGWKPRFLLMRTTRSIGSIWTLGPGDKLVGVKHGRIYREG